MFSAAVLNCEYSFSRTMIFNRRTFCLRLIDIAVVFCIIAQTSNAAKFSTKRYPAGVDFFEHEFPSVGVGVSNVNELKSNLSELK